MTIHGLSIIKCSDENWADDVGTFLSGLLSFDQFAV